MTTEDTTHAGWSCAARKQALPEPADCNWPICGCDPAANQVMEALEEQGIIDATYKANTKPRPLSEWREDMGDVLWWKFPITEPRPGYHTHFTQIVCPEEPGQEEK